jgi:hypothetical protein
MRNVESVLRIDQVASVGAQLRPALVCRAVGALLPSRLNVAFGVKGRFRMRRLRMCASGAVPNNSFEPTLITPAPSLRVGGGAAQLNRYASSAA